MIKKLSNKEIKNLKNTILQVYNTDISDFLKDNDDLWLFKDEKNEYILLNKKDVIFFYYKNIPIPTLKFFVKLNYIFLKEVKVDKGAVKYILNGADVFRPGITFFEEKIKKGDIVAILSEDDKLLAVGESLLNYEEFEITQKGKVIKNLHYYNDKIFNFNL